MRIVISKTADELGMRAAEASAKIINEAIAKNGRARIILSTGASQFETLATELSPEQCFEHFLQQQPTHHGLHRRQ